jgi:hypothetical protein
MIILLNHSIQLILKLSVLEVRDQQTMMIFMIGIIAIELETRIIEYFYYIFLSVIYYFMREQMKTK